MEPKRSRGVSRVGDARADDSAEAMFRSFVERATAEAGEAEPDSGSFDPSDRTDPRMPGTWAESIEAALEDSRDGFEGVETPVAFVAASSRRDPSEEVETRAFQAGALIERLRASAPVRTEPWESVVPQPSEATQRREARKIVPDMKSVAPLSAPPSERSEDGLIPSGELDRTLTDMAVLLRYGHDDQVARLLEELRQKYASDLLLVRRLAEFYLTEGRPMQAVDHLFTLASGLFERRNVEGMKQALEQVLVIDPDNERARRLSSLLEQRPTTAR